MYNSNTLLFIKNNKKYLLIIKIRIIKSNLVIPKNLIKYWNKWSVLSWIYLKNFKIILNKCFILNQI